MVKKSLNRVLKLLDNISDGCYLLDNKWEIIYINKVAKEITHKDIKDVLHKSYWSIFPKYINTPLSDAFHKAMTQKVTQTIEINSKYVNQLLELIIIPFGDGLFVLVRDITEKKKQERHKEYSNKMETIGQMASAVAHEVRNPLAVIRGYLQFLSKDEEEAKKIKIYNLLINEIDRINTIINNYLALSLKKRSIPKRQNLNAVVSRMLPLLEINAIEEYKYLINDLENVSNTIFDEDEIRQLLINLVKNALEAVPAGGVVEVKTFEDKNTVFLSVRDNGGGIDPSVLDLIGTPFVTTKSNGTGLGLSICYSIARRNNAAIDFTTDSQGTTFCVRFPKR